MSPLPSAPETKSFTGSGALAALAVALWAACAPATSASTEDLGPATASDSGSAPWEDAGDGALPADAGTTPAQGTDSGAPVTEVDAGAPVDGGGAEPLACGAGAFCQDFESGLGSSLKVHTLSGGTVAVDSTRAHSGRSALHVKSPAAAYSDAEVLLGKPLLPFAKNSFFLRAFVYYAPPAAADNVYLFRLEGVLPGSSTHVNAQMGAEGYPYDQPAAPSFKHLSTLIYHSDIATADHESYRNPAAPTLQYGRWACWEWQVDGVKNQWRLWIDGVEHFSRAWDGGAGSPWIVPSASSLAIGIRHPHPQPSAVEVWFDDLVVASARVGCGQP